MTWKEYVKRHLSLLWYYPVICLEGLAKTTKDVSQESMSPGRDLNPEPPEYEARLPIT
jgi:hypothetical protein